MSIDEKVSIDFETRSRAQLGRKGGVGAYKYAEHPSTRVLILAIKHGNGPTLTWDIRQPIKGNKAIALLEWAITEGWEIHAYNSQFEWAILKHVCPKQLGLPVPEIEQLRCTAAVCRSAGLPPKLGDVAEFLKLPIQKDKLGDALIQKFSVPQKKTKKFIEWDDDVSFTAGGQKMTATEAFDAFVAYCARDVDTEVAVAEAMTPFALQGFALDWFLLDARLNDRGVPVDRQALQNALVLYRQHEVNLTQQFRDLTGLNPTQRDRVFEWLRDRGYRGANLAKEAREKFGNDDSMTPEAIRALDIKAQLSFAAIKKIPAMLDRAMEDDRIRGSFMWCGAQKTWRWTSKGVQWQNMKKPKKKLRQYIESAFLDIKGGIELGLLEDFYGDPYELIASLARYFVRFEDCNIFDLDYSSVEAKILPMLIECRRILDRFDSGEDLYTTTGRSLTKLLKEKFKVDFDVDRDMGKTVVLACIAEGELVLTDSGLVPIEKVSIDDLVWDGIEWVRHEGLIYQGIREVITYQGLTATPDHQVFVEGREGPVSFELAARQLLRIVDSGIGRASVRSMDLDLPGSNSRCILPEESKGDVRMRDLPGSVSGFTSKRNLDVLSEMQRDQLTKGLPEVASCEIHGSPSEVSESHEPGLQTLRSEGDQISIQDGRRGIPLDDGKPRASEGSRSGSGGQQRALRTWEPEVVNPARADDEHPEKQAPFGMGILPEGLALQRDYDETKADFGNISEGDSERRPESSERETEMLGRDRKKTRVYDLLNAGPRHRFTVSGVIVSNCQFQGGWNAVYTATGNKWNRQWCEAAAKLVREENPEFPKAWRKFQDTFIEAMDRPERWHPVTPYIQFGYTRKGPFPRMLMKLASGRCICWPLPEKAPITMVKVATYTKDRKAKTVKWERISGHFESREEIAADMGMGSSFLRGKKDEEIESTFRTWEISFYGHIKGGHYGRVKTYGGDSLQSATQGTGADLLAYGALESERRGFEPYLVVHDQCLAPAKGNASEFRNAMCIVPSWFKGFPLSADVDVVRSYCKN